jgi:hypothetical protein
VFSFSLVVPERKFENHCSTTQGSLPLTDIPFNINYVLDRSAAGLLFRHMYLYSSNLLA